MNSHKCTYIFDDGVECDYSIDNQVDLDSHYLFVHGIVNPQCSTKLDEIRLKKIELLKMQMVNARNDRDYNFALVLWDKLLELGCANIPKIGFAHYLVKRGTSPEETISFSQYRDYLIQSKKNKDIVPMIVRGFLSYDDLKGNYVGLPQLKEWQLEIIEDIMRNAPPDMPDCKCGLAIGHSGECLQKWKEPASYNCTKCGHIVFPNRRHRFCRIIMQDGLACKCYCDEEEIKN